LLGVVIGPHALGFHVDGFIAFFSDLGLALLFFFAGYEIDVGRIRGQPLRLALLGWGVSLALGYALAGVLALLGVVVSALYTGSALTTTAIGTLIPILSDSGELRSRFGAFMLAAGAVGHHVGALRAGDAAQRSDPARVRRGCGGDRGGGESNDNLDTAAV
jgi:Kef-type K+ transport system membrane component KefB